MRHRRRLRFLDLACVAVIVLAGVPSAGFSNYSVASEQDFAHVFRREAIYTRP